ncbi:MAG: aminotransferase class V-fold PLP-dependent enzyme [Clostridiales bacterium]|nr:aminotransferase class V-fold PLP-dependent enzyme [Clostridiales bacterium]
MIYLDSAATTLQKPPSVLRSVLYHGQRAANPGRGGYAQALYASELVYRCRTLAAGLFDAADEGHVVMTHNATHGLNIAIRSLVKPGGTAVISGYEHNAVTRTLAAIPEVTVRVASGPLFAPQTLLAAFERQLPGADAAICTQVSNVFGYILPIGEVAALCRRYRVPLVVDAAQSAGVLPVETEGWGAAYVAMPGHKGLYGPQGTGLLICSKDASPQPLLCGGTGSASRNQAMPDFLPDRLEAGTLNVCGIAGLNEGLRFVREKGTAAIGAHEGRLTRLLARLLREKCGEGVTVFAGEGQSGVLSFRPDGRDCEEFAAALADRGFAVRAGLHCAPLAHESAGTLETGTVRASFSAFNREEEVRAFADAVRDVLKK